MKYALSVWIIMIIIIIIIIIQKRTFKAGLALATLVLEGRGGYLNYSSISLMRTTLDRDNLWHPFLSFQFMKLT